MNKNDLIDLKKWFADYVSGFYTGQSGLQHGNKAERRTYKTGLPEHYHA